MGLDKMIRDAFDEAIGRIECMSDALNKICEENQRLRAQIDCERAAVRTVADEMAAGIERVENNICNGASAELGAMAIRAYQDALDELRDKCGVTPTEVQS